MHDLVESSYKLTHTVKTNLEYWRVAGDRACDPKAARHGHGQHQLSGREKEARSP